MKQFLSTCLTLTLAMFALVQNGVAQSPNVLDGAYVKETNLTKRVIPYPHLREADVMYKRLPCLTLTEKVRGDISA